MISIEIKRGRCDVMTSPASPRERGLTSTLFKSRKEAVASLCLAAGTVGWAICVKSGLAQALAAWLLLELVFWAVQRHR